MTRKVEKWIRPWNIIKFDDLYNRDDRFFSVVIKGLIFWLNNNIILYNKPIPHYIFNTGSSYMYMESNGYEFSWVETSGEDQMYNQMPRCIIEMAGINVPTEELTNPYTTGIYERRNGNDMQGFNANMRRVPIEIDINLKYVLANFNESIVLVEELINNVLFQRYYSIAFLGQTIRCSIEFPQNFNIELNRIDMTDPNTNQKNVQLSLKISTNYPAIDEKTEVPNYAIVSGFMFGQSFSDWTISNPVTLLKKDGDNMSTINIHVGNDNILYDQNNVSIESDIIDGNILDNLHNPMNRHQILVAFNYNKSGNTNSTLFNDSIDNTLDNINRNFND